MAEKTTRNGSGQRRFDLTHNRLLSLFTFMIYGYLIEIGMVTFEVFKPIMDKINTTIAGCGGLATVLFLWQVFRYFSDKRRNGE